MIKIFIKLIMNELVAPVDDLITNVEYLIDNQIGILPLPFPMMDKSNVATCKFYPRCRLDRFCPFRHSKTKKNIVCKHWLRGLCKKGDDCEFLHVYDLTKMPECYFYSVFKSCTNLECAFLHINREEKIKDCPWYNRGFCERGPLCRLKHTRRIICLKYLNGFCPYGNNCEYFHGKYYVDMNVFKNMLQQRM